eukprot:3914604-Prymnesium_polylepis.2
MREGTHTVAVADAAGDERIACLVVFGHRLMDEGCPVGRLVQRRALTHVQEEDRCARLRHVERDRQAGS